MLETRCVVQKDGEPFVGDVVEGARRRIVGEVMAEPFGDSVEVVDRLGLSVFEQQPSGCTVGGSRNGEEHPWLVGAHWADA